VSNVLTALTAAKNGVVLADITVPKSSQPPGTAGLMTVMGWVSWGVTFLCIIGVFIVAATMAFQHRRGEGSEAVGKLGWVMGACVLVAAAGPLVNVLV
jgi:hypothetical protein